MKRLRKKLRERGKVRLSEYFKELKEGDKVVFMPSPDFPIPFHKRYRGLTGTVVGKRGRCYVVEVKRNNKKKIIISHAIHLKRIS